MIPIKGYATFDPLKHCWIGSAFKIEWFENTPFSKNDKIMSPLKRIAEETEQDYQMLEKLLNKAGVQTYRSWPDMDKIGSLKNLYRPMVNPRDNFAVIGEKLYAVSGRDVRGCKDILKQINRKNLHIDMLPTEGLSTAEIVRVGKDLFWDHPEYKENFDSATITKYKKMWEDEGFRVHMSSRGYHSDASFCVVKPGCIVSLYNIQDYAKEFPGWEVLYLPDQSWKKLHPFRKITEKVGGRWWIPGEEDNDKLIAFVNEWLNDWVGFVEETVFDVNMLSLDQNTIICNNYNKEVFDHFKKHKVEPVIFNFRHRYFWDNGVHCITQDLYREGTMEDYFG